MTENETAQPGPVQEPEVTLEPPKKKRGRPNKIKEPSFGTEPKTYEKS